MRGVNKLVCMPAAVVAAAMLMLSCSHSATHGDLTFAVGGGEAEVTGVSHSADSVVVPETVVVGGDTVSVTAIGRGAFDGCTKLVSVTIPQGVTKIGKGAFDGCTALRRVYCRIAAPLDIDSTTFRGVDRSRCQIFVPMMCEASYENADEWRQFGIATDAAASF